MDGRLAMALWMTMLTICETAGLISVMGGECDAEPPRPFPPAFYRRTACGPVKAS